MLCKRGDVMKKLDGLEYLKLSKWDKFVYRFLSFFAAIPGKLLGLLKRIGGFFKGIGLGIGRECKDLVTTFVQGDWKTKLSYPVMGFGSFARGQILRGLMFFVFEAAFVFYMFFVDIVIPPHHGGLYWLRMLPTLGTKGAEIVESTSRFGSVTKTTVYHDNSFKILLYGVLTLFFVVAFLYTWRANVRQNKISEQILKTGKPLRSGRDDLRSLVDDNFHKTLLALPLTGILVFTVMPIFFMILVAFTNYDFDHDGLNTLFQWDGLAGFKEMLTWEGGGVKYSAAFGEVLTWTLIWAFFATFTNYFLGIFVAMMINKKGIKLKKLWRTVLVLTIAIPQFISLLFVHQLFEKNGIVNGVLIDLGIISKAIDWWNDPTKTRILVILINIWIGIPYLMLIATGILMNIPADLYESAKIDGASGWKQFSKITLPYMLFITGPYLLTSFTGNMNNFNVIYLLTTGGPVNASLSGTSNVGHTDLLITWLFKLTTGVNQKYYLASVVGIMVFLVVAVISLVVYNLLPSVKNEEDFQ